MKIINQKKRRGNRFSLIAYKSISYLFIIVLLFLVSCGNSSDSVSPNISDEDNAGEGVIAKEDFSVTTSLITKEVGYDVFNYGVIVRSSVDFANYSIKDIKKDDVPFANIVEGSIPEKKIITVDKDGNIEIGAGLKEGEYSFILSGDGYNEEDESVSYEEELKLKIVADQGKEDIDPSKISFSSVSIPAKQPDYAEESILKISYSDQAYKGTLNAEVVEFVAEDGKSFGEGDVRIENDEVILSEGLPAGVYKFKAKFSADNYSGEYQTGFYKLVIEDFKVKDRYAFTVGTTGVEFGYDEGINYGEIKLNEGVTADFAISTNIAGDAVSVDAEGKITIDKGVPAGTHYFTVKITGTEEYVAGGFIEETYEIVIEPINMKVSDFIIKYDYITKEEYQVGDRYGNITLKEGVTADFVIAQKGDFHPLGPDEVAISENGEITFKSEIKSRLNQFKVVINGTGNYKGSFSYIFELNVIGKVEANQTFVDENDFTINVSSPIILEEGYTDGIVIGKFSQKENSSKGTITASYATAFTPKVGNDSAISVDSNGEIKVKAGLAVSDYSFRVEVTANGSYVGKFRQVFVISIVPKEE